MTNKFDPAARRVRVPVLKPEDELCCVVNVILPKKLRSQMLTSSTNAQFRKLQSQETLRNSKEGIQPPPNNAVAKTRVAGSSLQPTVGHGVSG